MVKILIKMKSLVPISWYVSDNKLKEFIYDWWDKTWDIPINGIRRFERMIYWGWNLRNSYDWDFGSIDDILYLKLKRIHGQIASPENMEFHKQHNTDKYHAYKALQLAIKLLERVRKDEYNDKPLDTLDKKFGEISYDFEPVEGRNCSRMIIKRDGEIECEESRQMRWDVWQMSERRKRHEYEIFTRILVKYKDYWWD